jgi:hypothetical protein
MSSIRFSIPLTILFICVLIHTGHAAPSPSRNRYKQRLALNGNKNLNTNLNNSRPIRSELDSKQVYLLVSTSSKLYCMRLPDVSDHGPKRGAYYSDLQNYEIIYEERAHPNCWITDALYVKSEQLIYVNVYNSSSASSDIFTLRHDPIANVWIKTVLYREQSFCLGLTYSEEKKELYWTAAKSIVAGSSIVPAEGKRNPHRVLFNLDSAKKLLYLKYDALTDTVFVSTLNYVYACSMRQTDRSDCKIIVRDLVSARGLYLDTENRFLYAVDHKRRNIKRVRLPSNPLVDYHADNYDDSVETVLSTEILSDLGDTFYMTLHKSTLIWCEFSGKIKFANMNNTAQYATIFSTNEYTYSVNIMDNVTLSNQTIVMSSEDVVSSTVLASTTQLSITDVPNTSAETTDSGSVDAPIQSTLSENTAQISVEVIDNQEQRLETTEPPLVSWVNFTIMILKLSYSSKTVIIILIYQIKSLDQKSNDHKRTVGSLFRSFAYNNRSASNYSNRTNRAHHKPSS